MNHILKNNPRIFRIFHKEKCRIVIFDNDSVRTGEIIRKGVSEGFLQDNFSVVQESEYRDFFSSYRKRSHFIQHIIINNDLHYEGVSLYRLLRRLDVTEDGVRLRKSKVRFKPEEFESFLSSCFIGLLPRINLHEHNIVDHSLLLHSKQKSLYFEALAEHLHEVADNENSFEPKAQNILERILREILSLKVDVGENGTVKEVGLEYFLPVKNALSISTFKEDKGDSFPNGCVCITNIPNLGSKCVVRSAIGKVIENNKVGVIQDIALFQSGKPYDDVLGILIEHGLNSCLFAPIYKPGQKRQCGILFAYSSHGNAFDTDHGETVGKLAKLVGHFCEKFHKSNEIKALTEELLNGIKHVRDLQDCIMGSEILSSRILREEFLLDIDCYIRHPFIGNNSFVSLNGDGLKFKMLSDSKLQITAFDICDHGIYPGMIGLMTHTVIDTFSYGRTGSALLSEGNVSAYLEKFSQVLYDYYYYDLSRGELNVRNMGVFHNFVFNRNDSCFYLLRLGSQSPVFYSAKTRSIAFNEEHDQYSNMVVGVEPYREVGSVSVQKVSFEPRDLVVFFSDGLVEQQNIDGCYYGTKRIEDIVLKYAEECSFVIKERILEDFLKFLGGHEITNEDDLSFIVIKRL